MKKFIIDLYCRLFLSMAYSSTAVAQESPEKES
jgi:hypothetical protein